MDNRNRSKRRIGRDEGEETQVQAQIIFSTKSQKKISLTLKEKMPIKVQGYRTPNKLVHRRRYPRHVLTRTHMDVHNEERMLKAARAKTK